MAHEGGGPHPGETAHHNPEGSKGDKAVIGGLIEGIGEVAWSNGMGFFEAFHKRGGKSSSGKSQHHK